MKTVVDGHKVRKAENSSIKLRVKTEFSETTQRVSYYQIACPRHSNMTNFGSEKNLCICSA